MGLAFGMCGYPKEGGDKNSAQDLPNHWHYSDSVVGDKQGWVWSHLANPGCANPGRLQAEFSRWETGIRTANDI